MGLKLDNLSLNLPFGLGGVTLSRSDAQRRVAWALYVQLATRVSTQKLDSRTGSAREALDSLHGMFEKVRETLSEVGPDAVAGPESVGPLAIRLLNDGLRPFMAEWHTKLAAFENGERLALARQVGPQYSGPVDESTWTELDAFYEALEDLRENLSTFARAFALVCGAELPEPDEVAT